MVQALYRASQAGVKIDLDLPRHLRRCGRGVPGVSDNIRVTSVVDRFLEHSRIFYFENGGATRRCTSGSADWMDRNLSRRVEVVFPIEQPDLKARVIDEILALSLADTAKSRELQPDGSYRRVTPADGQPAVRSQQRFLDAASEAVRVAALAVTPEQPSQPKVARKGRRPGNKSPGGGPYR